MRPYEVRDLTKKQIGARAKQRRLELNLSMQYVADQLGVNKSTVQRYESGAIDNTKKMVWKGCHGYWMLLRNG